MKQNLIQSLWFIFLLLLAFVVPVFGIMPALYLWTTMKKVPDLAAMRGWTIGALVVQGCYLLALVLIFLFFVPA